MSGITDGALADIDAGDCDEDEFAEVVEDSYSDDDAEADEDFETMKKAIDVSAGGGDRDAALRLVPASLTTRGPLGPLGHVAKHGVNGRTDGSRWLTPRNEAKGWTGSMLLESDSVTAAKHNLRSVSYGRKRLASTLGPLLKGQDPRLLFHGYDRDHSGEIGWSEFKAALRKGGRVSAATLSDADLRKLFNAVDGDGSGDVSIAELTSFIWGDQNQLNGNGKGSSAADHAAPSLDEMDDMPSDGLRTGGGSSPGPSPVSSPADVSGGSEGPPQAERAGQQQQCPESASKPVPARKVSGVSRHLDGIHGHGYHLSRGEREQREQQASVLRQIQQAMHSKRSIHGHSINDSRDILQSIDRDQSGMVDTEEFADALHQLGLGLTPQQVEALVRRLDRDGNGEIDYEELLVYLHGDLTHLAPHLGGVAFAFAFSDQFFA